MSLKKETTLKGIALPDAIFKITHFSFVEDTTNQDGVKNYKGFAMVSSYTDETKEFNLEEQNYEFSGLTESELTLPVLYTKLKELEEFTGAVDV